MSRQDKATTDRHARILRDLVKQPDNKNCADCRKNDARWASWNLGVYVCIRCSGIHRSMGTHISKVKSIDLDIWTPEQMENIKKWGNKRANLYWEKHLKAGHVPPDHKIESFIRSKYESRRWAMEGPLPADPSVLEGGAGSSSAPPQYAPTPTSSAPPAAPVSLPRTHPLLSRSTGAQQARPTPAPAPAPAPMVDLFGDDPPSLGPPAPTSAPAAPSTSQPASATTAAKPAAPSATSQPAAATQPPQSNIFDLDFRTPTPTSAGSTKPQTAKADIMSLFSTASPMVSPPAAAPAQNPYASWNGGVTSSAPPQQQQQTQQQNQAQLGGWGLSDTSAWGSSTHTTNMPAQNATSGFGQTATASTAASAGANGSGMNANPWGGSGFGGAAAASGANAGMASGTGMGMGVGSSTGYGQGQGNSSGMGTGAGGGGMTLGMGMGADPWATPAPQPQAKQGGLSASQAKKAEHDPFANIWQ